ncbi:MAG: zinc-binding dehydrogenase [Acidimicrobiales bacterium]
MRAVTIRDGGVVVAEHPDPQPGRGQLLVSVRAAGLNGADMLQVAGRYPPPQDAPADIPGLELAGEVVAVGPGASRFEVGQRVMSLVDGGAQAELALVQERLALHVPERVAWEQAGGFPEAFTTAHDALFTQCSLGLGQRLCVHAAAGGVGLAAVQLGLATGASVTATVRRAEHRAALAALGAEVVAPEAFVDAGPFDVILELVGGPNIPADLDALAVGGRIVVIGVLAGAQADLDLRKLMARRGRISASTLRARPLESKATATRGVEAQVLPLLASKALRVPVFATFPLTDAPAAYSLFAAGGKLGKIVLTGQ